MIGMIRSMVAKKAGVKVTVEGTLPTLDGLRLQSIVRAYALTGWIQLGKGSALLELEGPKYKIEALLMKLQSDRICLGPTLMKVAWLPYEAKYESFRVAV